MNTKMSFRSEEEHKLYFENIRKILSNDGKTIRNGLSASDRHFLRLFFHYESHPEAKRTTKKKERNDCPAYLKDLLFENLEADTKNGSENTLNFRNEEEKSLSRVFTGSFREDETATRWPLKSLWFSYGENFDETQQIGFVRAMQSFSRIYSPDISFKKLRFGTKILVTGPVRI